MVFGYDQVDMVLWTTFLGKSEGVDWIFIFNTPTTG